MTTGTNTAPQTDTLDLARLRRERSTRLLRSTADAIELLGEGLAVEKDIAPDSAAVDEMVGQMIRLAMEIRRAADAMEPTA